MVLSSGVMNTHHVDRRIVRIVLDQHRFDIQQPSSDFRAEIIVEPPLAPLGPYLACLVNLASAVEKSKHLLGNCPCRPPLQVFFNPLAGDRFPSYVSRELPLTSACRNFAKIEGSVSRVMVLFLNC